MINACDAGREGELIFTYIYQLAKCKLPVKRAWMQTMTQEGIREAFRSLRDGEKMRGLAEAARCRSESDWLIGINGTRALTKRMFGSRAGNVASVGRVQTPTLAIVYARELEIRNFKPRAYWRVTAEFQSPRGLTRASTRGPTSRRSDGDEQDRVDRIWEKAAAEAVLEACKGHPDAAVTEERKASTQASPRLYDLTTLQREVNNRFGLSARRTSQIAQALYERHKMITYPRTDSRALPEDYIPTVQAGPPEPPGGPGRPREQGPRGAVARPQQEDLQQRPDLRPLRDHPDGRGAEAPRGHGGEGLRHDRPALRGGLLPLRGVRYHDPDQHRGRPHLQDRGQGADVPGLARRLREDRHRRRPAGLEDAAGPRSGRRQPAARPDRRADAPRGGDPPPAPLHGGHPPLRHGGRRQAGRRRGAGRGDEGARARAPRRRAPTRSTGSSTPATSSASSASSSRRRRPSRSCSS